MHEYSIVQSLLDKVHSEMRNHGAATVHKIRVRIGELSGVEGELVQSAFLLARHKTPSENAELEVIRVDARWTCSECGQEIPAGGMLRCLECDAPAKLSEGEEILLERIEMEVD